MGVSITRYKCDLDGVCRVLREGEMEWLPIDKAAQFKIDVVKMTENIITHYTGSGEFHKRFSFENEVSTGVIDAATQVMDTIYVYKVLITSLSQLGGM